MAGEMLSFLLGLQPKRKFSKFLLGLSVIRRKRMADRIYYKIFSFNRIRKGRTYETRAPTKHRKNKEGAGSTPARFIGKY